MSEENQNETTAETPKNPRPEGWEREVLEKVLLANVQEQRKARLWGYGFKGAFLLYLIVVAAIALRPSASLFNSQSSKSHTAVVDLVGTIAEGEAADSDNIIEGLRDAEKDKNTKGIILRMNSPGGSPVQAGYIYEEIRRIKKDKPTLPIYAVISDLCASGCYYAAAATDKIFVHPSSVVGSIGVIMGSFGFVDTMQRVGVERRLIIAGEHKALLDPFSPLNDAERQHFQGVINLVHQQFINAVKQGRGNRLKESPDLFSGLVWNGEQAISMGLVDATGDVRSVANDVVGEKELSNFTPRERFLDRVSRRLGTSLGTALASAFGQAGGLR